MRAKSGPLDLVTDADEAAETMITAGLASRFPGCVVVGEEATSRDPALLDRLADAELAFVVDPVDGTFKFAMGLPLFGCMAAAIIHGEIVAAAILDPVGDDIALALRGEGAWIESADGRLRDLHVAAPVPVAADGRLGVLALPAGAAAQPDMPQFPTGRSRPGIIAAPRTNIACYRQGSCHFLLFNKLMPWDHAPGWLLHQEAGGYSAQFDGTPYGPAATRG